MLRYVHLLYLWLRRDFALHFALATLCQRIVRSACFSKPTEVGNTTKNYWLTWYIHLYEKTIVIEKSGCQSG
jgi:hypothetical protein